MNPRWMGLPVVLLGGPAAAWLVLAGFPAPATSVAKAAPRPAAEAEVEPIVAPQGGFGTIKGKLVWGGDKAPEPAVIVKKGDKDVKDGEVCAVGNLLSRELVVDPATKGIRYGFVFLKTPSGKNPEAEKALLAKEPEVLIDQKNCEFLPYAAVAFTGQKVIFKSTDPVGHNLRYSGFRNPAKNVVLPPNGQIEEKLQAERLPLELKCDIHPWMKGWLLPLDHPFFAVTREDGSFEITGVPEGKQTLIVWQEKVGYVNPEGSKGTEVVVKAGGTVDVGVVTLDPTKVKK